jgi:hypothetical protein
MLTAYLDAKSPVPNLGTLAQNPSPAALETLTTEIAKLASESKVSVFNRPAFDNFKTVPKYSALAAKGPLPASARDELKKMIVWGGPLDPVQTSSSETDWLIGAKYELLENTAVAALASPSPSPDSLANPR